MRNPLRKEIESYPEPVKEKLLSAAQLFAVFRERYEAAELTPQQPAPIKQARPLNWPADKVQRYRTFIVRKIWEPDLRAELVDRVVELVVNGFVTYQEVDQIIEKAAQRKRRYDDTNGEKGSESMWRTIGAWTKEKWIESGRAWTATNKRLEPKPPEVKPITEVVEPTIQRDHDGRVVARVPTAISKENQELLSQALNFNKTDSIL